MDPRSAGEPDANPRARRGAIDDSHWSRARTEKNRAIIEYYRERSRAPGVKEGGGERNFYCMACDGVIPFEPEHSNCPHCQAAIDPHVKRYFNWVEINDTPRGDARFALTVLFVAGLVIGGLWWLVRQSA